MKIEQQWLMEYSADVLCMGAEISKHDLSFEELCEVVAPIAKKYGESSKMVNAILSHHEGIEAPASPEAFVIAAADAISAARPGARRESVEHYVTNKNDC